jgi:hypothetical protein
LFFFCSANLGLRVFANISRRTKPTRFAIFIASLTSVKGSFYCKFISQLCVTSALVMQRGAWRVLCFFALLGGATREP